MDMIRFISTAGKLYKRAQDKRWRTRYLAARAYLTGTPVGLTLDTSLRCNLSCSMCSLPSSGVKKGVMSMETFERLMPVFPGVSGVSLHCSGEPLLNRHVPEMLRAIKQASPDTSVSMFTNGMLLNEDIAERLVRYGLDNISFSIDGATPATFERIRKGAKFDRVLANVHLLARTKQMLNSKKPAMAMGSVVFEDNVEELLSLIQLAKELDMGSLSVNGLEPYSESLSHKVLYGAGANYTHQFSAAKKKAKESGVKLSLPLLALADQRTCPAAKSAVVSWDGRVMPCATLTYERTFYWLGEKRKHPSLTWGNVNDEDFSTIWNSPRYRNFRAGVKAGNLPELCDNCLLSYGVICPP